MTHRNEVGTPILDVTDLNVVFPTVDGDVKAVSGVSFSLVAGETLAIVGESGSGKSVTARAILRLIEFMGGEIRSGSIKLNDKNGTTDLVNLAEDQLRTIRGNRISMIFQEPMTSLNPVLTVGQQVIEAVLLHEKMSHQEARKRALETLKLVRIPEAERRMEQHPHELSGGMRQRVMIAMALACKPDVLIADEPTTALDVTIQSQILELIRSIQEKLGMAVVFITHDMGVVAEIADRVVVMYKGEVVEHGPVLDVFERPRHDYTKALLAAIPKLGSMTGKYHPEPFSHVVMGQAKWPKESFQGPTPASKTNRRSSKVLEVVKLTTRFPIRKGAFGKTVGNVHAVEDVSFDLYAGETLSIVGESGCGKSTAGRSIMRLVEPTSGDIVVDGRNIMGLPARLMQPIRKSVQMIFQDPYASLNPRMRIGETLAEPLVIRNAATAQKLSSSDIKKRTASLLDRVGLPATSVDRYPHEFSGGQRQRICIARALTLDPKILIADEAVSALDVSVQAQVINLLMELQAELGISILFISHDMAVVERISHRVAVMYLGQIMEIGPREAVFSEPAHSYTQKLLGSVPIADPRQRKTRFMDLSEIPSPVRPVGFVPPTAQWREVGPHHFCQVA